MAPVQQFTEEATSGNLLLGRIQLATTSLGAKTQVVLSQTEKAAEELRSKALVLVRDPQFRTCTLATATGAVTFGTAGGAFGLASGVVVGSAAGVVPALLTFGMSIPAGAFIGGSGGFFSGIIIGGSAGGISGYEVYKYRVQIKDGAVSVKLKTLNTIQGVQDNVCGAHGKACEIVGFAKSKANEFVDFATSTRAGVTSTAAASGAVVGGVTGGAAGAVVGAAVGMVPAIFTFGLSIPIAAATGLCLGSVSGGGVGAVGGGAVGYGGFTYRKEIAKATQAVWTKALTTAASLKGS